MKKALLLVLVATFFITSCASSTFIRSAPSEAKVYLDGRLLGTTPVRYSDTAVSGSTKNVILKKEGYKDKSAIIRKENVKIGPIIGGLFFLFPFIWTLGYPDEYTFELESGT